jgi:gas vesicle protein
MSTSIEDRRDYRFALGLLAGACVGAGVVLWLAPRTAAEIRGRVTNAANDLGERASERYDRASARVGAAADQINRTSRGVINDVADVVARGAREAKIAL